MYKDGFYETCLDLFCGLLNSVEGLNFFLRNKININYLTLKLIIFFSFFFCKDLQQYKPNECYKETWNDGKNIRKKNKIINMGTQKANKKINKSNKYNNAKINLKVGN